MATVLLLAGCGWATPDSSTKNDLNMKHGSEISCLRDAVFPHIDHYDLNGDGSAEEFLVMRCENASDPRGDQFEVLPGGGDGKPVKLVLQMPQPSVVDRVCFANGAAIYSVTSATGSKVWQVKWAKDKPKPGPPTPGPPGGCPEPR
ncbi:hypothetical protein ACQPZX_16465 [Actinoplanes sp. CA-142083]|uniref:hypothetical protein n=1 Tax=Actinoplanes sp. CA-142083 TaxID=3239903 RepID=UPI003D90F58E